MTIDPLTFDAYGTSGTGGGVSRSTQVHNTGEIWCSTLWDMNWLLINRYGFEANIANGFNPADPRGNTLALQLVMDGLKLQPSNPTFTQARDAILQADQVLTGGANQREIWTAFARRGLGWSAYTGTSASATSITIAFDIPPTLLEPSVLSVSPQIAVGSPMTSIELLFSKVMDTTSFNPAADVNSFFGPGGVDLLPQITGHSWSTDARTLTINFNAQSTDGVYTLNLGPQILAGNDGHPMNQDGDSTIGEAGQDAYTATFRFDSLQGQVVSTSPANGGLATLPLTSIDFNFNEPFDPATLQSADLAINQGSVTGVSALDADTARFTVSGLSTEGTLSLTIAAGAISDTHGNPISAFVGSLSLDLGTVPFPIPLTAVGASGTLIYAGTASGTIDTNDDTDSFTLLLDAGQVLTLLVDPVAGLRPQVEVRDPSNGLIGSAASPATGSDVLLQTVAIAAAGVYTFTVSSVGAASSGSFTLGARLNAALEAEHYNGPANDSLGTAQDLAAAFGSPLAADPPQVASVLGKTPSPTGVPVVSEGFESGELGPTWSTYTSTTDGRIRVTSANGAATGTFALVMDTTSSSGTYALNEAVWTVDLGGVLSPTLQFHTISFGDESHPLPSTFIGHVNGDGVSISADGNTWHTIWSATPTAWTPVTVNLATAAASAGIALGANFRIKFQQYDNFAVTTDGRGYDALVISTPASASDYYSLPLVAGQHLSLAGAVLPGSTANLALSLLDSTGATLATGIAGSQGFNRVISGFTVPADGLYHVLVSGDGASDYALSVIRGGAFDLEPNSSLATAQPLGDARDVLGSIRGGQSSGRLYVYDATANQIRELNITTGAVIRSFASPVSPSSGPDLGMATTGNSLLIGGLATQPIYELNLDTGATIRTIPNPSIAVSGMAFLNNEIYALTDATSGRITVLNYTTGAVARTIIASPTVTEALGASATDLYGRASSGIYRIDPLTGAGTLWGSTSGSEGLGIIGNELFSSSTSTVFVYDLVTKALKRSLTGLVNLEAIGADGGVSVDQDYYSIALEDGSALLLSTATPGGGPGEFVNALDPAIEVYDPSGVLIGSNDNGAPDGRNASLEITAAGAGTYTIRVFVPGGLTSEGEYILSISSSRLELVLPPDLQETAGSDQGTLSVVPIPGVDLLVNLVSSDPARLSVPASVIVPGGVASVPIPLTIHDNGFLDGLQEITLTATATEFPPAAAATTVHDDETATLSVNLPSTTSEGDGPINGTIQSSAAPTRDILVQLLSDTPSRAAVPLSVLLPAGQTSAPFVLTVQNDTFINGSAPVGITASVENWSPGLANINISDDDAFVTVVLPPDAWEGQTLTAAGTVQIGGTLGGDLIVSLLSSDESELTLPATVTILAGQTSAPFTLTLPPDAINDGLQTVEVTATAAGLADGSDTLNVQDANLDHVVFDSVTSPKTAAVPFGVTARAYNIDDQVIAVYSGTAQLGASGSVGILPMTPTSASFVAGVWTGNVSINAVDPSVTLSIDIGGGISDTSDVFATLPGPVTQFQWDPISSPQSRGFPFAASLTARDANGFLATGFNGAVTLTARGGASVTSGIVVSEVYTGTPDSLEFTNVLGVPIDISGWQVWIYDSQYWPNPRPIVMTFPAGSVIPAGGVFLLEEFGAGPGAYPHFYTGDNIDWTSSPNTPVAVLLRNGTGQFVDFMAAAGASPALITSPGPIPTSQWSGGQFAVGANHYLRIGNSDQQTAADWSYSSVGTMGTLNTNLTIPFALNTAPVGISPGTINLSNGVWTGNITVLDAALGVFLRADDGAGHVANSSFFDVSDALLSLAMPADLLETAGSANGLLSVTPAPAAELVVTLTNTRPARITLPPTVIIPAGQTSVSVPITVHDNADLNGPDIAQITASAGAYTTGMASIALLDDETAVLSVSLPASAGEADGPVVGTIFLSAPADSDVTVSLLSDNPARGTVPASVLVPAGQTQMNFNLTLVNNTIIDGQGVVQVQASVAGWTTGADSIAVLDNDNQIELILPAPDGWEGQSIPNATVQIGGTLTQDLLINLFSSDTTELTVPVSLLIPAGQTSASFALSLLADSVRDGTQTATLSTNAPAVGGGIAADEIDFVVRDADLDHFALDPITGPQTAAVTFHVVAQARNIDDELLEVYNQTATLSAAAQGGGALPLTQAWLTFTSGIAMANIAVLAVDPAVTLTLGESPIQSLSNAFAVQAGPVAKFHFAPITGPKNVNAPFSVTLTARDANGFTATDFNGSLSLAGSIGTANVLFADSFEDGDYLGWLHGSGTYTRQATNQTSADGAYSVTLVGGSNGHNDGLYRTIAPLQPTRVKFNVRASSTSAAHGYFIAGVGGTDAPVWFYMTNGRMKPYHNSYPGFEYVPYRWYSIEMQLDWTNRVLDYYVDGQLQISDVPFRGPTTTGITRVDLYNHNYAEAWWDGIEFSSPTASPVPIGPTTATFVNGVWTGSVTVPQAAAGMHLLADDGAGRSVQSAVFDVIVPPTAAPDLAAASDSGTSDSDNLTNRNNTTPGAALQFSVGNTTPGATVTLYANGDPIGSALAAGTSTVVTTNGTALLADGPVTFTARQTINGSESADSSSLQITIDTIAPAIVSPQFDFEAAHRVLLPFSEAVIGLTDDTFDLLSLPDQTPMSESAAYASGSVTLALPGILPDGNYRLVRGPGVLSDLAGNALAGDYTFDFFVLAGDATRDRTVDLRDLYVVSLNWLQTDMTFSQGDFNYDGIVDKGDLTIVSRQWQYTLAEAPPPPAATTSLARTARRTAFRAITLIE